MGWQAFEAHCQGLLGLDATISSGSRFHDPGDGVDRRHHTETDFPLIIDAKYSEAGSFTVNRRMLSQWQDRAAAMGKRFVLPIRLVDTKRQQTHDYAVMGLDDLAELLDKVRAGGR